MTQYIIKRILLFIPMLFVISMLVFVLIQLPPGDYLTTVLMRMAESGEEVDQSLIEGLTRQYGLDRPLYRQYLLWISNIVFRGNFGRSFEWGLPVADIIWERLAWTVVLSLGSIVFIWIVSFPIGVYSATHQYSFFDYLVTLFGFLGKATPNFLLALILMWAGWSWFGWTMGGLFSPEYQREAWSWAKFVDLLKHLWVPLVVLGTAGTANLIRILRSNLLDELEKPYVQAARAKGVSEFKLIWKYPVRIAINPIVSTVGGLLPEIVSGTIITAIVLNLPTVGPLLFTALTAEDMQLASSIVMVLAILTVIGTFISDMLLLWIDPRIRFDQEQTA